MLARTLSGECFLHGEQEEQASGASRCSAVTYPIDADRRRRFLSDGRCLLSSRRMVLWNGCAFPASTLPCLRLHLGRQLQVLRIAPVDVTVPADVRYLPGTVILETSWGTPTGWIIVRDALRSGPGTIRPTGRGPTVGRLNDYEAEHVFLRTIHASGEVQTAVTVTVLDYVAPT